MRDWIGGRAGRASYWLWFAALLAVGMLLAAISKSGGGSGLAVALTAIQVRRLHDFGRSGWWVLTAVLGPIVVLLLGMAVMPQDDAILVAYFVELAATVVIGVIPGDPGENRFGPPQAKGFRKNTDIFS